jgi:hypothetical protein
MNKEFFIGIFLLVFLVSFVSAVETNLSYSTTSSVQIKQLKYEPYPVNPDEYFDFWVEVSYIGGNSGGLKFELDPQYPFSLDPNEDPLREYQGDDAKSVVLHYKVRVDKDAIEGTNELKLKYELFGIWYSKNFDIAVSDAQTSFDAVIQDITDSQASIAIANIGKNIANSVIVRIPLQDGFVATGTDGQMVGNLESGDYTIVSFSVAKKPSRNSANPDLLLNIDYTDNIGERRKVELKLPVNSGTTGNMTFAGRNGTGTRAYGTRTQTQQSSSFLSKYWIWLVIVAIVIIGFYLHKKYPGKIKGLFSRAGNKNFMHKKGALDIPDWIAKEKSKQAKS